MLKIMFISIIWYFNIMFGISSQHLKKTARMKASKHVDDYKYRQIVEILKSWKPLKRFWKLNDLNKPLFCDKNIEFQHNEIVKKLDKWVLLVYHYSTTKLTFYILSKIRNIWFGKLRLLDKICKECKIQILKKNILTIWRLNQIFLVQACIVNFISC